MKRKLRAASDMCWSCDHDSMPMLHGELSEYADVYQEVSARALFYDHGGRHSGSPPPVMVRPRRMDLLTSEDLFDPERLNFRRPTGFDLRAALSGDGSTTRARNVQPPGDLVCQVNVIPWDK